VTDFSLSRPISTALFLRCLAFPAPAGYFSTNGKVTDLTIDFIKPDRKSG